MVERVAAELGRLDILVSDRRLQRPRVLLQGGHGRLPPTIDVTMWGAFYCLRAAVQQMIRQGQGGSVVVVSSPHAHVADPVVHGLQHGQGRPRSDGPHRRPGAGQAPHPRQHRLSRLDRHARRAQILHRGSPRPSRGALCRGADWPGRKRSPAASSSSSIPTRTTSPAPRCPSTAARRCRGGRSAARGSSKPLLSPSPPCCYDADAERTRRSWMNGCERKEPQWRRNRGLVVAWTPCSAGRKATAAGRQRRVAGVGGRDRAKPLPTAQGLRRR